MVGATAEEVAKFLANTADLDKTMIGEYLGERDDMCIAVMHAYVDNLDFTDITFDEAIRCGAFSRAVAIWRHEAPVWLPSRP
jgi:brefeldin A-inhibited guanine nucleotide-exchange protein